jgi:hypothetical protein
LVVVEVDVVVQEEQVYGWKCLKIELAAVWCLAVEFFYVEFG